MKVIVAIAAALLCASAAPAGEHDGGLPPDIFKDQNVAIVIFANRVTEFCGEAPEGMVKLACVKRVPGKPPLMILPNPNAPAFEGEFYSRIASHELGHVNGWPGDHPR